MKLWKGRFSKEPDPKTNDFNSSISIDSRMFREDILGSIAHAEMLGEQGIIEASESKKIILGLKGILSDLESGSLSIDPDAEDIHTFIEEELTSRLGDTGKRLHTARSRNDQVALDIRLYLKNRCEPLLGQLRDLIRVLAKQAKAYADAVMPGYTHMQRAQPVTFGHYLLAYCEMLLRDISRFEDALRRMDVLPLGAGALAGTTYPLNRERVAELLGFSEISHNSLDAVSDRDFCAELIFSSSLCMSHLSRLAEELVLYSSWEFRFIELDDAFCTGSSIMPQKKNPDLAELIRGKSGRVYGDLVNILTVLKGLPLAYNKDLQEDKEAVFDAVDTLSLCLTPLIPMLETMKVNTANMRFAASSGFINATDCADYLVSKKGLPFRTAYKLTGELVAVCIEQGKTLETLPLSEYQKLCPDFDEGVYEAIDLDKCVGDRTVIGGPSPENVRREAERVLKILEEPMEENQNG